MGIGLISYSIYLWHLPVFAFARLIAVDAIDGYTIYLLTGASIVLGFLSWRYVEIPFRQENFVSKKRFLVTCILSSIFIVSIGLIGVDSKGFLDIIPQKEKIIQLPKKDHYPDLDKCLHKEAHHPSPDDFCVLGNRKKIRGVLLGDSHADALAFTLEQKLIPENLGFIKLTYSSCPPVKNIYLMGTDSEHKCFEFNQQTFKYLKETPDIQYVILSARWTLYFTGAKFNNAEGGIEYGSGNFIDIASIHKREVHDAKTRQLLVQNMYRESIEDLLKFGKKVILIYPVPEVGWDVPKQELKLLSKGINTPITTSYSIFKTRNSIAMSTFDSIPDSPNLFRVRPDLILCNAKIKDRCITKINNKLLYRDDDHLSDEGADLILNEAIRYLDDDMGLIRGLIKNFKTNSNAK